MHGLYCKAIAAYTLDRNSNQFVSTPDGYEFLQIDNVFHIRDEIYYGDSLKMTFAVGDLEVIGRVDHDLNDFLCKGRFLISVYHQVESITGDYYSTTRSIYTEQDQSNDVVSILNIQTYYLDDNVESFIRLPPPLAETQPRSHPYKLVKQTHTHLEREKLFYFRHKQSGLFHAGEYLGDTVYTEYPVYSKSMSAIRAFESLTRISNINGILIDHDIVFAENGEYVILNVDTANEIMRNPIRHYGDSSLAKLASNSKQLEVNNLYHYIPSRPYILDEMLIPTIVKELEDYGFGSNRVVDLSHQHEGLYISASEEEMVILLITIPDLGEKLFEVSSFTSDIFDFLRMDL